MWPVHDAVLLHCSLFVPAIDNRIFIYLDALLADFNIEISVPQKQSTARQRLPRASSANGALTDQSQVV